MKLILLNQKRKVLKEKRIKFGRELLVEIRGKKYVISESWYDKKDNEVNDEKKVFSIDRHLYKVEDKKFEKSLEFANYLVGD